MPPRKKKAAKTPQKTKSSSPSSTFATIDPSPKPLFTPDSPKSLPEPEIQSELNALQTITVSPQPSESHETIPAETTFSEPPDDKGSVAAKTVLRVRKVVKKKIVKKLVPKRSTAATPKKPDDATQQDLNPNSVSESSVQQNVKEEDLNPNLEIKEECQQVNASEIDLNPNSVLESSPEFVGIKEECQPVDVEQGVLKSRKIVRKKIVKKLVPKGSLAANKVDDVPLQEDLNSISSMDSAFQQDAPEKMEEDEKVESVVKSEDDVEIKEECGVMEVKDGNLESGKDGDGLEAAEVKENEAMGLSERMKRRKAEIFIGGLDRDAKEEDIRSVFGKVGEISELRMMMDGQTGKNKGYAFLRYLEPSQAKRAVAEFAKVEVCSFSLY